MIYNYLKIKSLVKVNEGKTNMTLGQFPLIYNNTEHYQIFKYYFIVS